MRTEQELHELETELKPCPFCGGHAKFRFDDNKAPGRERIRFVCVSCRNCAAQTMWMKECDLYSAYPEKYTPLFPDKYEPDDGVLDSMRNWNRRADTARGDA